MIQSISNEQGYEVSNEWAPDAAVIESLLRCKFIRLHRYCRRLSRLTAKEYVRHNTDSSCQIEIFVA